jgi:uncharacterized membrane protein YciS (DUF1049 family)
MVYSYTSQHSVSDSIKSNNSSSITESFLFPAGDYKISSLVVLRYLGYYFSIVLKILAIFADKVANYS